MTNPTIRVSSAARSTAAGRQLDWLLGEALGAAATPRVRRMPAPWLAAACVLLGIGAVFGAALWRHATDTAPIAPQHREPRWHECHGPAELAQVPSDVRALRGFDFDDAACTALARFPALEWLDLGAMDVDDAGVSRPPAITDDGVRALAKLPKLRWLGLAQCQEVHGYGLRALEALPRLEHLDLTHSGVVTEAVERLPRLPRLRSLVLSHCRSFRGSALLQIASIAGLERLELDGCTTVTAADALRLATMPSLRHLDLRYCSGRYRGQTAMGFGRSGPDVFVDEDGDGLPERRLPAQEAVPEGAATFVDGDGDGLPELRVDLTPPAEDGIGITDEVVHALAKLPLETLRLGGCSALTDDIGPDLAKMTTLRELDLAQLPKADGALLQDLPVQLERLAIAGNPHWRATTLARLPTFTSMFELRADGGASGYAELAWAAGTSLRLLEITAPAGRLPRDGGATEPHVDPKQVADLERLVAAQVHLAHLILHPGLGVPQKLFEVVGALPNLRTLELHMSLDLAPLASSRTLQELRLVGCRAFDGSSLASLRDVPLRKLDLRNTRCDPTAVQKLATEHWPGCDVVLPNGTRFRAQ